LVEDSQHITLDKAQP